MKHVAAYLLAVLGGNASPAFADIENILSAVGIDGDAEKGKLVVDRLKGKSVEAVIAEGSKHLVSVSGGGGAAPAAAAPVAAAAAPAEDKKKKEEPKEESDDDMGFGLFD